MQKINQKKTVEYLKAFYPDIKNEITNLSDRNNFAGIMQTTVDHMKDLLEQTKIQSVIRNLKRMDWIYKRGNSYVRYLIENIFIRSFESLKRKLIRSNGDFSSRRFLQILKTFIWNRQEKTTN